MEAFFPYFPLIGSIQTALSQPVFPGKLVMWLLFMLSIVSWVLIISKALQLQRTGAADRKFSKKLRGSRTTLELFEQGWYSNHSLHYLIYQSGASEVAFQLLGSREPTKGLQVQVMDVERMGASQTSALRAAFGKGLDSALSPLRAGLAGFSLIAAAAALLGAIGFVWTLMSGLDVATSDQEMYRAVGAALGFLSVSLLVVAPATLARMSFAIAVRRRRKESEKFHDDLLRVFERKFCGDKRVAKRVPSSDDRTSSLAATVEERVEFEEPVHEDSTHEDDDEFPPGNAHGKKQYHSVRDRLLGSSESPKSLDELQVNPIARQAATVRSI
ncbi:MAG: hypothetical protein AAGA96_03390 [Verrucomicrobiota bacterium]